VECGQDLGDAKWLRIRYEAPRRRAGGALAAALDAVQLALVLQVRLAPGGIWGGVGGWVGGWVGGV
jgi:hypothetical protein